MLKFIVFLSALTLGTAGAHAENISGYFSAVGSDTFTGSTVSFGNSFVLGSLSGDFATYLNQSSPLSFVGGNVPYTQGTDNPVPNVTLFTVAGNGETFSFIMNSYTASYVTNDPSCGQGSVCLNATATGFFTGSGALNGQSGPATFVFTSQYAPGVDVGNVTTFSASASAPTPEPASLAMVGSGLLAIGGFARRRFNI